MEAIAHVSWPDQVGRVQCLDIDLKPLQVAEIAASYYGFFDVDLVDNDPGVYQIVARAKDRTVTAKGKTLTQAVERLLGMFGGGQ